MALCFRKSIAKQAGEQPVGSAGTIIRIFVLPSISTVTVFRDESAQSLSFPSTTFRFENHFYGLPVIQLLTARISKCWATDRY